MVKLVTQLAHLEATRLKTISKNRAMLIDRVLSTAVIDRVSARLTKLTSEGTQKATLMEIKTVDTNDTENALLIDASDEEYKSYNELVTLIRNDRSGETRKITLAILRDRLGGVTIDDGSDYDSPPSINACWHKQTADAKRCVDFDAACAYIEDDMNAVVDNEHA